MDPQWREFPCIEGQSDLHKGLLKVTRFSWLRFHLFLCIVVIVNDGEKLKGFA